MSRNIPAIKSSPVIITQFNNNSSSHYKPQLFKESEICPDKFSIQNRRYLGSKFKLAKFICWVVENNCSNINSVADIFAGTGVVANLFNSSNKIIVNDILYSNCLIYHTFFSNQEIDLNLITDFINHFNSIECNEENYFSKNFGNSFFTWKNACKIGYIRDYIENNSKVLNFRERAILISSLIYATDKVANTCGHYDAYRRKLDSTKELKLLLPNLNDCNNENNEIYKKDANELVKEISPDLTYIDTPYNSRQYGDAYHLLENLATWKKPEVFGVAKKMKDRKNIKSDYCTVKAPKAFEDLINNIDSKYILVSYNNIAQKGAGRSNAKISNEEIIEILNSKGDLELFSSDYKVFTTGKTNISDHKELLYLCKVNE